MTGKQILVWAPLGFGFTIGAVLALSFFAPWDGMTPFPGPVDLLAAGLAGLTGGRIMTYPIRRKRRARKRAAENVVHVVGEPIVAWRAWRIDPYCGGPYRLHSLARTEMWPAGETMVATCFRCGQVTDHRCMCGLWAFKDANFAFPLISYGVVGEVYLAGKILECEHGYRAEFAYPKSLFLWEPFAELREGLERDYGVPVAVAVDVRWALGMHFYPSSVLHGNTIFPNK